MTLKIYLNRCFFVKAGVKFIPSLMPVNFIFNGIGHKKSLWEKILRGTFAVH